MRYYEDYLGETAEVLMFSVLWIKIHGLPCHHTMLKEVGHLLLATPNGLVNTTGWPIKNGHQRNWSYTLAGGINQKSVLPTFLPYIYRYWKIKQLLHLVAFNFSYGLQLIRCESTDFCRFFPQTTEILATKVYWEVIWLIARGHFWISFCIKYFSDLRKNAANILCKSDL